MRHDRINRFAAAAAGSVLLGSALPGCVVFEIRDQMVQANEELAELETAVAQLAATRQLLIDVDERLKRLETLQSVDESLVSIDETLDSVDMTLARLDEHLASLRGTISNIDSTIPFLDFSSDEEDAAASASDGPSGDASTQSAVGDDDR